MSSTFFNPGSGQLPDAHAVSRGLSNMTGLPQKAIMHKIVDTGLDGAYESNKLSVDKLFRFLTQPRMMQYYISMADEQVNAVIRSSQLLAVISPIIETHVRIAEVMFKEINLVGMDQVDALSPASLQTFNEFKKAVSVLPYKKQAKVIVKTLIRQLAGFDRDMDNANEVESQVLALVGNLYTEMTKNVLDAIVASILPYGYKVLGNPKITPFVAIAEAIDSTFMAGQTSPELAIKMLGKRAQSLHVDQVNVLVGAGNLEFWRTNMDAGREVDFIKGYYSPESGVEFRIIGQEEIGTGQLISRGVARNGQTTINFWEAPVPKINSNDAGDDRMQAVRTVMGQFFTFPQNNDGQLISGEGAELANNTVDVFTIDGNSGKNVVYHLMEALRHADVFNEDGDGPHPSLQKTIDSMNGNASLKAAWDKAMSGRSRGSFNEGDSLTSKHYRSIPVFVRYNQQSGQFEFAKRLGDTNELTDTKLLQVANQLVAHTDNWKGGDVSAKIETVTEFVRDTVQTEVTNDFVSALILANQVVGERGPWVLNDYGTLNLPSQTVPTSTGLPPLFHNVAGMQTLARERNTPNSIWKEAGQRAYAALQALRSVADGISAVSDQQRDDMLQYILELIYVMEYKKAYPSGVFLRASSNQPQAAGAADAGDPAEGYQAVSSVLRPIAADANPTYEGAIDALSGLKYAAPEVELLRLIEDGTRRLKFVAALLEVANPAVRSRRKQKAVESLRSLKRAFVEYSNQPDSDDKERNGATLNEFVNSKKIDDSFLNLYDQNPPLQAVDGGQYALPGQPEIEELVTEEQIASFNAAMQRVLNEEENATGVDGYDEIPTFLKTVVVQAQTNVRRGRPVGDFVRENYVLAPLVSTQLLEKYANNQGGNALAIPAYEGIADVAISRPIQNARFKHNAPFAGKHFRSHFELKAAPLGARDDVMDLDEEYERLIHGQAMGANGNILDDTSAVESRLEFVVKGSATAAERVMASVIMSLPNTLATHARLSKVGARVVNVALLRPFETNVLSLISIVALNGFGTMVCPTEFTSEHHSQVSTMFLTMAKEIGTNVIDDRRVTGICGFTSHRVVGGYNQFFVGSGDLQRDLAERPSVIAVAFPDTAEFSLGNYLHLFNNLPIRYGGDLRIDSKCKHPGALHLMHRFPDLYELVKEAENNAVDIHTTINVSPILSRGMTRRYNPKMGRYETIVHGVSKKSAPLLNTAGYSEGLYNGGLHTKVTASSDFATAGLGRR